MFVLSDEDAATARRLCLDCRSGNGKAAVELAGLINERAGEYLRTTLRRETGTRAGKTVRELMSSVLRRVFNSDGEDDIRDLIESAVTDALNSHYREIAKGIHVRGARGKHRNKSKTVSYERMSWQEGKRQRPNYGAGAEREHYVRTNAESAFRGIRNALEDLLSPYLTLDPHDEQYRAFTKAEMCDAICYALDKLANDNDSRDEWTALCKCYANRNPLEYKQLGQLLRCDQRTAKKRVNNAIEKIKALAREYLAALPSTSERQVGDDLEDSLGLGVADIRQRLKSADTPTRLASLEPPSRFDGQHTKPKRPRRRTAAAVDAYRS